MIQYTVSGNNRLAYQKRDAAPVNRHKPGIVFLCGFRSDMNGTKAQALDQFAQDQGLGLVRFDYSGHGQSQGQFADGSIGSWLGDALHIFDHVCQGPQIVVGSSMGGWIALHLALQRADRVKGLVGIASAPDFTQELIWDVIDETTREKLLRDGVFYEPSAYDDSMTPITNHLIEDGKKYLLLNQPAIPIACPIRLIHGMKDKDVPWEFSKRILEKAQSPDVHLHLIKDGDHRLNRLQDTAEIVFLIENIA